MVMFSSLLIFFPPIGTITAIVLILAAVVMNLHLVFLKIRIQDDTLIRQSIFGNKKIKLQEIRELKSMKVIGTVANSIIAIRKIVLDTDQGYIKLRTITFRWQDILDLLEALDLKIQEYDEGST